MPNLQELDLRDNGIRVLPERLLAGVPAAFRRLDIRDNPVARIPVQVLVDWDDGAADEEMFVDQEDRLAGFQYRLADGTTLSRLVLLEDGRITTRRNFDFQIILPDGIPQLSENVFLPNGFALNPRETAMRLRTGGEEPPNRLNPPASIIGTVTVHNKSISWTPDEDFEQEIDRRMLLWQLVDARIFYLSNGVFQRNLAVEAIPVEVRESFALGDGNPALNRIAAGAPAGSPVIGWQPQPMPSAGAAVAAGLDYAYALLSDAGGLFVIDTASGALSVAPGRSLSAMPSSHHLTVMAAVDGPGFTLTATAPVTVETSDAVFSICGRSPRVRAAILASSSEFTHCASVDRALLGAVGALTVTSGGGTVQFLSGDFHGLPGLRTLDLSDNGIRDFPEDLLDGVADGLIRLDLSGNPATRIPVQILAVLNAGNERGTLLMDEEDRLSAFQYTLDDSQATPLSRAVLHEGRGERRFRVSLPDDIAGSGLWEFALHRQELNNPDPQISVRWERNIGDRIEFTEQSGQEEVITMSAMQDDDFIEETRRLIWVVRGDSAFFMTGSGRNINLFTEAFPVEVRETLALRDGNPAPNRVAPGTPAGLPVTGWRPRAVPSASSTVTAALNYEYELTSNPDGLFAINTANGALSLAPGGVLPAAPSSHDAVVMVAAAGQHLVLTATAAVTVVQDTGSWYICDRTPAVQRAILAAKGGGCAFVAGPLAFGALAVTGSVAALQRGDFRGVGVTDTLSLSNLGLQGLSAEVFEGIGVIHGLDISGNNLRNLPVDVFSHLPAGLCRTRIHRNPLTRLPIRLLAGLKRIAPVSASRRCSNTAGQGSLVIEGDYPVDTDGDGELNLEHTPTPDYLGNIRYIDADTGRAVSSGLVLTEGESRRLRVELDALPGVNGRLALGGVTGRFSPEPAHLVFGSFSETARIEVTVTANADDNREHETAPLFWRDVSDSEEIPGDGYYEGTVSSASLVVSGYDGDRATGGIRVRSAWGLRTPPLPVRILEPVAIEDTDSEPNRIWRGVSSGTGVVGWAPRILVDGAASAETSYSLVSDAGGLFAIDTASGALSAHGGWPLMEAGRRDIIVGTDYRGAPATRTVAVEVFGALSLEDADVAQNAATVGDAEDAPVRGIRPLMRADSAVVTSGVVWTLAGGGGLFHADTSSGAILLTRSPANEDTGVSTIMLTASYAGAEASLPLPVVVSLPGRVNICDRTPEVQTAILAVTASADACGSVSLSEIGGIMSLRVNRQAAHIAVTDLSNLDFRRMPGLERLWLNGLGLTNLPAGIFRTSIALSMLRLQGNDMATLPAQLLADLGHLNFVRVDPQVRVGDIRYRVDGEVATGTLVISKDQSRDVLVEAVGGLHTTLTLTFQAQGAPVVATPTVIEINPSAAAHSVRLSAVADADIVHNKGPVSWKWDMATAVQRGTDDHIPTPDLAVRVNETVALTDTNPAVNRLREDAVDDVAVAGWSPQVTAGGVAVPTTAVSYRLTADAGGLFEANSATGALSLADGRALDYAVSSRHTVTVEANYDGVAALHSVVIDVQDVTDICSRTDAVANAILAATPADDACGAVLVSELEAITALTATAVAAFVTEADFDGLPNLEDLDLIGAGAVRLPVQFVANFATGAGAANLRVDRRARISGLVYRDDGSGEVITPPLVLDEGATRTLRVGTGGVSGRVLRFSLAGGALRGVTATDSLELGSPSTPTLELTALTDEDFNPASGMLVWALESPAGNLRILSPVGADLAFHLLLTEGLRVDVREADVFEDADPADNRISEAAVTSTAVSGWSPRVLVNGVATTAVRYRLADDAGGLFAIDSATGALSLAGELDYEASTFHAVEVAARVTDTGVTASLAAVIRVDNVVEEVVLEAAPNVYQIEEYASSGTRVDVALVVKTEDDVTRTDSVTYSLTGSTAFRITTVGEIFVSGALDYEETTSHTLRITATYEGVTSDEALLTVNVEDLSLSLSGTTIGTIIENATSGAVVQSLEISALFGGTTVTTTADWALSGTGEEVFIVTTDDSVARLQLSDAELDRETTPTYTLTLMATYLSDESASTQVTVNVQNAVESVTLEAIPSVYQIKEGVSSGTRVDVALVVKTEDDVTRTDGVMYELTGSAAFRITTVGEIFVSGALDYEETTSHTLRITAIYQGVTSDEALLIVNVEDLSLSLSGTTVGTIAENATSGTTVTGMEISALFGGTTVTTTADWALSGTGVEVFIVTTDDDIARLQLSDAELDRETTPTYTLTLMATYLSDESASTQVTVNVQNAVESVALEAMPDVYQIREGVSSGTRVDVALVVKTEDDVTRTDDVTYSLTGSAAFRITTVGEIFVSGALDYEETTSHTLRITATYEGVTSDEALLTVNVEDLSLSLSGTTIGTIIENATSGAVVQSLEISALFGGTTVTTTADWALSGTGEEVFIVTTDDDIARLQLSDAELDRETTPTYTLTLMATYLSDESASTQVTVNVQNAVESVTLEAIPSVYQIKEGVSSGTRVDVALVVKTEDDVTRTDDVTYSLTGSAAFRITTVGEIFVSGALDYEETTSHTLRITATYEGVTSDEALLTVNVEDLSLSLLGTTIGTIAENATSGTTVTGMEISALFGGTTVTTTADWALSGTGAEVFIVTTDDDIARLQLSDAELDRETTPTYTLTLMATYLSDESASTQVTVNVQNAVESVTLEATPDAYQIKEGVSSGTRVDVALVVKTEDDVTRTDDVTYSLTGSAAFRITTVGEIFVSGALDYEETTSHTLRITATYEGVTSDEALLTVNVEDLSLSLSGTTVGTIAENATSGTTVTGMEISALFGGTTVTTTADWALSGTGAEVFIVTTDNDIARLQLSDAELDRETTPTYTLTLMATHLSDESASTQVTVNVQNAVESVTLEAMPDVYQIREGVSSGTRVDVALVVKTEDDVTRTDDVTYSLTGSAAFRITTVGEIFVSGALDYEETTSHTLRITATYEGVTSDEALLTVNVEDLSLSLSGTTIGTIIENATSGAVVQSLEISALFGGTTVTTTADWALSGTGEEVFIVTTDDDIARLQLSDAELDRETTPTYTLTLMATYLSDESASTQVTVNVQNAVESVTLEATPDAYQIKEGVSSGTRVDVALVVKTEDDVTRTDDVTYSLTGSTAFRITTVGEIFVSGALDYEETTSHTLRITATYEGVTSNEALLTVNVEDLSLSLSGTTVGTIAENATSGTVVTGLEISALFGGTTVTTTADWALSGTGAEVFVVTTNTGAARLQLSDVQLDHETTPAYTLSLRASWLGETTAVPVSVEVTDVNRLFIELTGTPPHIVTETAPPGTRVGDALLTARTEDGTARTSEVDWHISPAAGLFRITSVGAVIVAGALDYETSTLHTLIITASWQSMTSNEERLTIFVADVERDPQLVDLNSRPNTALNTTDARVAGLNLAFLTDGVEQTGNVEWIFADATPARTAMAFTINTATGIITLNAPLTATLPQTYQATVTATQPDRSASLPLSIRVVSGLTVRIRVFLEGAVIP
ncbi:MAG: hypothetical protein OXU50_05995 [Gammaproteobacteria bacterium]|nr:hypothetical protein [Gammaproteobacteria bacterium]